LLLSFDPYYRMTGREWSWPLVLIAVSIAAVVVPEVVSGFWLRVALATACFFALSLAGGLIVRAGANRGH
jgi:uncharacterized membrane protein YccC